MYFYVLVFFFAGPVGSGGGRFRLVYNVWRLRAGLAVPVGSGGRRFFFRTFMFWFVLAGLVGSGGGPLLLSCVMLRAVYCFAGAVGSGAGGFCFVFYFLFLFLQDTLVVVAGGFVSYLKLCFVFAGPVGSGIRLAVSGPPERSK